MHSYTTQSHQRNYQGNVVVENPNPLHAKTKHHQRLNVFTTLIMATAVIITGSMLGTTALHNQQLKSQIQNLSLQVQAQNADEPTIDNTATTQDEHPQHHRHGKKRGLREIPISDQHHDAESLPSINNQKLN